MKVVIIGAGNVATILGKKIHQAGHEIVQVVSRNTNAAKELAAELSANAEDSLKKINKTADIYLIAVSDTFISGVANQLKLSKKIIVHTAGSVSINDLYSQSHQQCKYGVIYPLQTLRKELEQLPAVPVLIDSSDVEVLEVLKQFVKDWAHSVDIANDEQRFKMHIAAVICNNFTNYLFVMAEQFCSSEGLNFKHLYPLIEETIGRLQHYLPSEVQTGPAIRRDIQTINVHLEKLRDYPKLEGLYKILSASIIDQDSIL